MNPYEVLIYHYSSKNEEWYDATENVESYEEDDKAWLVKFKNINTVHVSYYKMRVFTNPEEIEFAEIYYKDSPCYEVVKLLKFSNVFYKIFYKNGYTRIAKSYELKIIKDVLQKDASASGVMSYYRRLVQEICTGQEDEFLQYQFDDIDYVNEDSVLALYLKGKLENNKMDNQKPWIAPFGINMSQANALRMAFDNRISIIEGPPGTGKTQTILNIISNILINNKTVAVVSNNNSATDNIYEKLEKYGYSFIAAPLGKTDNVDRFFSEYISEIPKLNKEDIDEYKLKSLFKSLPGLCKVENDKKKAIERQDVLNLEYTHFLEDKNLDLLEKYKIRYNKKPVELLNLIVRLKEKKKIGFFTKLSLMLNLGVRKGIVRLGTSNILDILQNSYYLAKKKEIQDKIDEYTRRLENESIKDKLKRFTEMSKVYFTNYLVDKYKKSDRKFFKKENYKSEFDGFVNEYPLILSSTYALAKCSRKGYLFDYLIVDESSQVNMASALLSMRIAKNIVVVGDIKQLPQIDDSTFKERNDELLKEFNVSESYSYYGNSIMSSLLKLYDNNIPRQMLKEHYRCESNIIGFCNEEFYNNELVIYNEPIKDSKTMTIIKTVPGNHARSNPNGSGLYNEREIDEIKNLIEKGNLEDIGVITPYRYQSELIQEKFGDLVESSTIHKFQGREKKTIIFSSVVNDVNDFVGNDNLINVAVSRATDKFILVTSDKVANSKSGVLSDLVNYIKYHDSFGKYEEGSVKSIYDILYNDYSESLMKFRKHHHSEEFDTENITKQVLEDIISSGEFSSLRFAMHVSLKDFIKLKNVTLTKEEFRFYSNNNSHVDFLIYNRMSKIPLAAIEVDGVSFHEKQKVQLERDKKKNSILSKVDISLLRLKTTESNEEARITNFLKTLI